MRIPERAGPSRGTRVYGRTSSSDEAAGTARGEGLDRPVAHVLGIPDSDMTPPVQAAMDRLLAEVSQLHDEVASLRERLNRAESLADTDPLVPLRNRRAFVRELERMIAYAARPGNAVALLMVDVDGLKPINDQGGHAAGDEAIRQIAAALVECTRGSDLLGRLGGDEFGVVLMDTDRAGAEDIAARITATVAERVVLMPDGPRPLSVSCGLCAFEPGLTMQDVLARADAALYRQKAARPAH
ncbi:GGDEF domain-containing protein [Roseospira marina]|nr:GGDEF domain-containing protein [Roseospira marina]MBB4312218.1 diguanylate cyclase (GGDEF)-like protein [Roseospira marina]MBB5085766.1 diguanylate cyclase (GGDEF)-like protein [Roseospira marina]